MAKTLNTEPKVFIIESLTFDNEKKHLYEGSVISNILRLSNIDCIYYYIRTKSEFEEIVKKFFESNYRYLHISCHGGADRLSIETTLDSISFEELTVFLKPNFKNKRLFLSACSVVNDSLAQLFIPQTKCYSIIGPKSDIPFRDATIMWASFYHLMFNEEFKSMKMVEIVNNLKKISDTFSQTFNYYSSSKAKGFKKRMI